jgi:hypothetical protein
MGYENENKNLTPEYRVTWSQIIDKLAKVIENASSIVDTVERNTALDYVLSFIESFREDLIGEKIQDSTQKLGSSDVLTASKFLPNGLEMVGKNLVQGEVDRKRAKLQEVLQKIETESMPSIIKETMGLPEFKRNLLWQKYVDDLKDADRQERYRQAGIEPED